MTKELNKKIVTHSMMYKKYLNEESVQIKFVHNKQRSYCVNILRKTNKNYFSNVNISLMTDNRKTWRAVKLLFLNKSNLASNLTENDMIFSGD